jgi:mono/diheme cytochrome c family protein
MGITCADCHGSAEASRPEDAWAGGAPPAAHTLMRTTVAGPLQWRGSKLYQRSAVYRTSRR